MEDSFENDAVIVVHNSFSILQVMGLNEEKNLETDLKKTIMPLTYGFLWL